MKKSLNKATAEAMTLARELEKQPLPSREEIVKTYKEGLKEAERLRKLLKPQWFIQDVHPQPIKTSNKKKHSSTTKKKSL